MLIIFKDTPTICKKWGKSKFFIFWEYLSPLVAWTIVLFMFDRTVFKLCVFGQFNHDSCSWRHQYAYQWRQPKTSRELPLQISSKNVHFDHYSGILMHKCSGHMHSFSQNSIGRSGNWQKVKIASRSLSWKVLVEILLFYSLIAQSGAIKRSHPFLLFIGR